MKYIRVLNRERNSPSNLFWQNKAIDWGEAHKLKHWDPVLSSSDGQEVAVVIYGRPHVHNSEWAHYDGSDSFISRRIRNEYLRANNWTWLNRLSGVFAIIIFDSRRQDMHLITDLAGVCPIYARNPNNSQDVELASHPDLLAVGFDPIDLDKVSVAEFLNRGMVTPPHSYWEGISALEHGSVYSWNLHNGSCTCLRYRELEHNVLFNRRKLVDQLSQTIEASIDLRGRLEFGQKAIFLSGGIDSRIVAAQVGQSGHALTLYDVQNKEYRTVTRLVQCLDLKHQFLYRGEDYYSRAATMSPQLTGGYSSFANDHFTLIKEKYRDQFEKYDTLLTGCYADWLFKGIAHNRRRTKLLGRSLPVFKFEPFGFEFFGANATISVKWREAVLERLRHRFLDIDLRDRDSVEARRLFPLFQEETSTTRLALQRVHEWDPPFIDRDVLDVYLQIPWQYKNNHRLFERVCEKLAPETLEIPHPSTDKRINEANWTFFCKKLVRRMIGVSPAPKSIKKEHQDIYGEGSWVNFSNYMDVNASIQLLWNSIHIDTREFIQEIIGTDLWSRSNDEIREIDYHIYLNGLTFAIWYESRFSGRPSVL